MKKTLLRAGLAMLVLVLLALPALASGGDDSEPAAQKPADYRAGVQAIKAKDYHAAIDLMTKAAALNPKDADAFNYLGYAHRKLGDYDNAMKYYGLALELNPKHLGAHEYMGEALLELNRLDEAKKHLATLDNLCWLPCEEYRDLKKAVAAYEKAKK